MLLGGGVMQDPGTLKTVADNIAGRTICAFGEACAWPTQSFVEKFPEDFAASAKKSAPPPLPPEYTPEELIAKGKVSTVPLAHDPGWEKADTAGTICYESSSCSYDYKREVDQTPPALTSVLSYQERRT